MSQVAPSSKPPKLWAWRKSESFMLVNFGVREPDGELTPVAVLPLAVLQLIVADWPALPVDGEPVAVQLYTRVPDPLEER